MGAGRKLFYRIESPLRLFYCASDLYTLSEAVHKETGDGLWTDACTCTWKSPALPCIYPNRDISAGDVPFAKTVSGILLS